MYSSKQHAINHYKEFMENESMHSYKIVVPHIIPLVRDQQFSLDQEPLKMPPMVEANWDTNDTKEFDRLLNRILFAENNTFLQ